MSEHPLDPRHHAKYNISGQGVLRQFAQQGHSFWLFAYLGDRAQRHWQLLYGQQRPSLPAVGTSLTITACGVEGWLQFQQPTLQMSSPTWQLDLSLLSHSQEACWTANSVYIAQTLSGMATRPH
jgi:hypothetical protein